jgi:hypothetical protein
LSRRRLVKATKVTQFDVRVREVAVLRRRYLRAGRAAHATGKAEHVNMCRWLFHAEFWDRELGAACPFAPAIGHQSLADTPPVSTVGRVERYTRVTAQNDVDQDVHLRSSANQKSTLCGMKPSEVTTRDVTCYRCHRFSVGDI